MDALADAAGVSRATVYRLFPGKAALFREVVKTYAPFEHLALLLEQVADRSPEEVMPQVAHIIVELFRTRVGLYRTFAFEITGLQEEAEEAATFVLERGIGSLLNYLQHHMEVGHLRQISPLVALQVFFGPLVIHLLTRSLAEQSLGLTLPLEEVEAQFVAFWLRAMQPDRSDLLE
jgi:AcrR family transcriptional regulator